MRGGSALLTLPLKRIASVTLGKMIQSGLFGPDDIEAPYLRAAHVQPNGHIIEVDAKTMWFRPAELSSLTLRKGDVVVVEGGAGYGRSAVLREDLPGWGFQNSINRLRPVKGLAEGRFLDYVVQHSLRTGAVDLLVNTATIPHFTAEKLAELPVPVPPPDQQLAIADFLDRETAQIDNMIEAQRTLVARLMERRLSAINTLLAEAGGVARTPLGAVVTIQTGITLGKTYEGESELIEYPYLRVANVQTGYVNTDELTTILLPPWEAQRTMLRAGDVLITEGGDRAALARGSLWQGEVDPCLHQNHIYALRPKADRLMAEYLVYVLESSPARNHFERTRRQTTNLSATNSSLVRAFRFTLPSVDDQRRLVRRLDETAARMDALIDVARRSVDLLRERRAALITAAVTGHLDPRTGVERLDDITEGAAS